jgi:predicted nucleic-acid-binding protein
MKAVDTKVLARFFVDDPDDPESVRQRPLATAVLAQKCFVPVSVLLEFEWVLRGFYGLGPAEVERIFRALLGVEHWVVEDRTRVLKATDWLAAGLDFADALHLSRSSHTAGLLTFDRRFATRAAEAGTNPLVECIG